MLAVSKPAGVLSQGDRSGESSLLEITKKWLKDKYKKPGNVFLGLVHRLDRQVPGVLLFARTSKAAGRLSEAFRSRRVEKYYLAITERAPEQAEGVLEHRLGPLEKGRVRVTRDGKEARLRYLRLEVKEGRALLGIWPETGRKHQIRVQLAASGWPIVGDGRYGAQPVAGQAGIALVAKKLTVPHPTRPEELVTIEDPGAEAYLQKFWRGRVPG